MASTPEIRAPQAGALTVTTRATSQIKVPEAATLAVYNVPADAINMTVASVNIPYSRISQSMEATQATVMAVISGQIDTPKLASWSYTLDGHDMFVLRLGTFRKTLVFDLSTGQWSWFASNNSPRWRASTGVPWRSAKGVGAAYGSNIVVGDDSTGNLWVLDPEKGTDDGVEEGIDYTFDRIVTGQIPITSRKAMAVYAVDLSASFGYPSFAGNSVTLEYSDDQGNTYVTADEPLVANEGEYNQAFAWRSLGQVRAPGRLFRITDNGAFARIDSMSINE